MEKAESIEKAEVMEKLKKTLEECEKSINRYNPVNILIIIAGLLLILVPAGFKIKGIIDEKTIEMGYEIFVFVGIGLTIIITNLIINSKASILKRTRQLFQIQISYSSYLKQLEIIESNDKDKEIKAIESKRLEEVTNSTQETLCKYFDSLPQNE